MSRESSSWFVASTSPGYMTPRPAQLARTKSPISNVVSGASTDVGGACVSETGVRKGPGSRPSLARSQGTSRGGVPAELRKQKKHLWPAVPAGALALPGCTGLSAMYQKRVPEIERRSKQYCTPPAPLYVYLGTPSLSPFCVYTPLTTLSAAPETRYADPEQLRRVAFCGEATAEELDVLPPLLAAPPPAAPPDGPAAEAPQPWESAGAADTLLVTVLMHCFSLMRSTRAL
mmetsp:Transcript_32543/g.85533  ORF Transcript_32543/g.85533 Transcript_32543/m.85533 type:complete len:231 (-) Transcript_32543:328-1020(-)